MKKITSEWLTKAEGDFAMLERESRARKNRSLDGICFHAQQCAEKYLKARLFEAGIHFPKTHDLVMLLELVLPIEPTWELFRVDLAFLSEFAVAFRYPGETADKDAALNARKRCKVFRQAARFSLGLPA
jgi:HEPN domain-containing protein